MKINNISKAFTPKIMLAKSSGQGGGIEREFQSHADQLRTLEEYNNLADQIIALRRSNIETAKNKLRILTNPNLTAEEKERAEPMIESSRIEISRLESELSSAIAEKERVQREYGL